MIGTTTGAKDLRGLEAMAALTVESLDISPEIALNPDKRDRRDLEDRKEVSEDNSEEKAQLVSTAKRAEIWPETAKLVKVDLFRTTR